jgi:hypothetical protein
VTKAQKLTHIMTRWRMEKPIPEPFVWLIGVPNTPRLLALIGLFGRRLSWENGVGACVGAKDTDGCGVNVGSFVGLGVGDLVGAACCMHQVRKDRGYVHVSLHSDRCYDELENIRCRFTYMKLVRMLGQWWVTMSVELLKAVLGRPIGNCRGTWTLTLQLPHQ